MPKSSYEAMLSPEGRKAAQERNTAVRRGTNLTPWSKMLLDMGAPDPMNRVEGPAMAAVNPALLTPLAKRTYSILKKMGGLGPKKGESYRRLLSKLDEPNVPSYNPIYGELYMSEMSDKHNADLLDWIGTGGAEPYLLHGGKIPAKDVVLLRNTINKSLVDKPLKKIDTTRPGFDPGFLDMLKNMKASAAATEAGELALKSKYKPTEIPQPYYGPNEKQATGFDSVTNYIKASLLPRLFEDKKPVSEEEKRRRIVEGY